MLAHAFIPHCHHNNHIYFPLLSVEAPANHSHRDHSPNQHHCPTDFLLTLPASDSHNHNNESNSDDYALGVTSSGSVIPLNLTFSSLLVPASSSLTKFLIFINRELRAPPFC